MLILALDKTLEDHETQDLAETTQYYKYWVQLNTWTSYLYRWYASTKTRLQQDSNNQNMKQSKCSLPPK